MKQLQKLLALPPYHWYLLVLAMILLPILKLSLNLFGFKKTYNIILSYYNQPQTELDSSQMLEVQAIVRIINIASVHGFYHANCLTKSLLLMLTLKKRNIPCQLIIGVDKHQIIAENNFEAHAWVESGKNILNDKNDVSRQFKAFPLSNNGLLK